MFHRLVSRNDDLRRLVEKGYAVGFDTGFLIVRDIPYLGHEKRLQVGAVVAKLVHVDQERVTQDDHQVYFAGSVPHNIDGTPIPNLGGGRTQIPLSEGNRDVVVQRSFSNKPPVTGKFDDFFEKIESYVAIISGPAMQLHGANPYTFRAVETFPESVFKLHDTLTSRAEIGDLSAKFAQDVVAVIGLGGTGAYVLDFLVRTPVREVRAFDHDFFHVHNVFRSPGRFDDKELGQPKAEVYQGRYDNFRTGLSVKRQAIGSDSAEALDDVTFAFICVDKGTARSEIFDLLLSKKIPFIDVGMGLSRKRGSLNGMLRTTYYSAEHGEEVLAKGFAELTDHPDDLYRNNIQIGELNALNSALAVIRYKQLRGFYSTEVPYHHFLFEVCDYKIVGEEELS